MPASTERTHYRRTALAALLALAAGIAVTYAATDGFATYTLESARRLKALRNAAPIPDLPLEIAGVGRARPSELRAPVVLVDFIYTRCETWCTALGSVYAQLQQHLAAEIAAGEVQLLSISFDPERDGDRQLRAYRDRYSPSAQGWELARPMAAELPRWLDAFGVVVIADEFGGFTHNAAIHVIDAERRLIAIHDLADIDGIVQAARAALDRDKSHVAIR